MTETFNLRPTWMALTSMYTVYSSNKTTPDYHRFLHTPEPLQNFGAKDSWKGTCELLCDRAKATYKIPRPSELSPTHDRIQDPHHLIQSFMFKEGVDGWWKGIKSY